MALSTTLGAALLIHAAVLHRLNSTPDKYFFLSYATHFVLAAIIFTAIVRMSKKHLHLTGFSFMAGSLLKFAVFFIFFYPVFNADGTIDTGETLYFLIPYFLSLIIETFFLSKILSGK